MSREGIFSHLGTSAGVHDCSYLMVRDAVKSGQISYYRVAPALRKGWVRKEYDRLIDSNSSMVSMFDGCFFPKLNKNKKYILYINENHILVKNRGYFNRLRNIYDIRAVMLIRNMFKNKAYPGVQGRSIGDLKDEYDLLVTDELEDAKKYNLMYMPDTFSNPFKQSPKIKYDMTFIGDDKNRGTIIKKIAQKAKDEMISCNIKILGDKKSELVRYIGYIPYSNIIYEDMQSNCILEVLQPGQRSFTLRTQEAICLRKKLLTNNKEIVHEKFYDPRYIQVFDDIDDIDFEFIKKREIVSYDGYHDEFSSKRFFEIIDKEIEKMG